MSYLDKWFVYTDRELEMKEEIENAILRADGSLLTLNEFLMMYFLSQTENKKLTQNSLQDKLHLSASAISRMITKLEAKGCGVIQKMTCTTDKRATYIVLTPTGEDLLEQVLKEVNKSLEKFDKFLE